MSNEPNVRYNDEELLEFKTLIDEKIVQADEDLNFTRQQIRELSENGFHQQGGDWYDDTSAHTDLEMLNRIVVRQVKHIQDLKNALHRIDNKTYGICTVTGNLIDKNRLRAVPHATKSVDGKNIANKGMENRPQTGGADSLEGLNNHVNSPVKPVGGGKVRLPGAKRGGNSEEWEPNNENMEDAGYRNEL